MDAISVLIVEDDDDLREFLASALRAAGYHVTMAANGPAAVSLVLQKKHHVAIVDLVLPKMGGAEVVRELKHLSPSTRVIILTGYPSLESAVGALREQVFDYLLKPAGITNLVETVEKASANHRQEDRGNGHHRGGVMNRKATRSEDRDSHSTGRGGVGSAVLIGVSPGIKKVRAQIEEVAQFDMTVLIRGETGTGKDVAAQLIHERSDRARSGPFSKVNCPAVPENLLESEMFGVEKGAFTGAERQRPGRFELAAGGTIFLDEIGAISLTVQSKLLEVIEHKAFYRVGGAEKIGVDIRIVAATNAPLEAEVRRHTFREDLYYRLRQFTIETPPLRERREDIPLLVQFFVGKYAAKYECDVPEVPADAMETLLRHEWRGNVRELESFIARHVLSQGEYAIEEELEASLEETEPRLKKNVLEEGERRTIEDALAQTDWNQRQAAVLLGLSYSALRRRIDKYDIAKPGKG